MVNRCMQHSVKIVIWIGHIVYKLATQAAATVTITENDLYKPEAPIVLEMQIWPNSPKQFSTKHPRPGDCQS